MRFARNLRPVSLPYMFASGKHVFLSVHVKKNIKKVAACCIIPTESVTFANRLLRM